ncbi:hypothetical protein MMC09_002681 [Bachmanniomyces sp. S44760]|nr:hypothetical protein [Bachmanniomyces sp. S44760]
MSPPEEMEADIAQTTSTPIMPRAPRPSNDPDMQPDAGLLSDTHRDLSEHESVDIFTLSPVAALKMLCTTIETLVCVTGDVPPTPPISQPSTPVIQIFASGKENISWKDAEDKGQRANPSARGGGDIDGVPMKARTPIGSPEAAPTEPMITVGSNAEPLDVQHGAITRKFYSKRPPPIPLEEYLLRLHRYCPMSTAVYLATGLYIHRLAIVERVIHVTGRSAHRLVLAGLRVAMKALEDLSYPHRRFAKVGGVTEAELGRLEVSFCFLTSFELRVNEEGLHGQAVFMRDGAALKQLPAGFQPKIPAMRDKRKIPIRQIISPRTSEVGTSITG